MKSNDDFFIKISDPSEIRRHLLESSKILLKCMKGYEDVRHIREKKLALMQQLRTLLKQTSIMVTKFRTKLPQEKLAKLPKRYEKFFATQHDIYHKIPSDTEIEALERELSTIENKLSRI